MVVVTPPVKRDMVRLGDCCSVQNGYPFKSEFYDEQNGIPLIRVRSLKAQNCDIYYNGLFEESYLVNNGDILIGMDGDFQPCFWQGGRALLNQRVCRLINFVDTVDPYYIYHSLKKPLSDIENVTYFTTVKHLSSFTIQNILISLPPLSEQRSIAHILQTVQGAIQARRKELELERERKMALMQHLFTYGTRFDVSASKETRFGNVPSYWNIQLLDQCAVIQTGVAKGRKLKDSHTITLPYLRVANVQDGYLDLTEIKTIELRNTEAERYKLYPGDVLLTEGGDFDKLGRGFLWNGEIPECAHQNHIFAVRARKDVLLPEYLTYLIQSKYGKTYFLSVAHKTTNLACINSSKLKAFPTLLPSLDEQQEIATILQSCDSKIITLEKEIALQEDSSVHFSTN